MFKSCLIKDVKFVKCQILQNKLKIIQITVKCFKRINSDLTNLSLGLKLAKLFYFIDFITNLIIKCKVVANNPHNLRRSLCHKNSISFLKENPENQVLIIHLTSIAL